MFFKPSDGKSKDSPKNQSLIEMHNVDKVYRTAAGGYQALKSIDLEIGRGEFVGIIGRSGSRKSTIASARAITESPLEVLALDVVSFQELLSASTNFQTAMRSVADERMARQQFVAGSGD